MKKIAINGMGFYQSDDKTDSGNRRIIFKT